MFSKFYSYLMFNVSKKKSVWVVNGLVWLFYALILFIIPGPLKVNPLYIWTNSMFNFNLMTIIFLSIYCAVLAVCIFNEPREDGSELVIFSKPIKRWKIINAKFCCFLSFVAINFLVDMIMPLFCMCFGKYDTVTNPNGFEFEKLGSLELSIFMGVLITCLFFGSIAILISMKGNKPVIMTSTICISIVFDLISMILPLITKSPAKEVQDRNGIEITTANYYNKEKNRVKCFMTADDGLIDETIKLDKTTNEWNNLAQKESGLNVVNAIDVGGQLASIFQLLKLSGAQDADITSYGNITNLKFITSSKGQIFDFDDPYIDINDKSAMKPIMFPRFRDTWEFSIYGVDQEYYRIYQALGCSPDTVFVIDDQGVKLNSKFVNSKDIIFTDANGKNLIQEQKDASGKYQAEGSKEYALIRNKLIDYIEGKTLVPYGNDANFDQEIYSFLCKPITSFQTGNRLADSGLEAVIGKKFDQINDRDWSIAFAKVGVNLSFDLWDYFYSTNIDRLAMCNFSSKTPFTDQLVKDFNTRYTASKEWTLTNGKKVNNEEFCKKYRFFFYDESLKDSILYSWANVHTALDRFYKMLDLEGITLKYIDGFSKPADFSNPVYDEDTRLDSFKINTMRNNIGSIRELKSAYWYNVRKYVTNENAIAVWLIFSMVLFVITYIIYRRTDVK